MRYMGKYGNTCFCDFYAYIDGAFLSGRSLDWFGGVLEQLPAGESMVLNRMAFTLFAFLGYHISMVSVVVASLPAYVHAHTVQHTIILMPLELRA